MSKRVTLPGGTQLDMGDADAIRAHAMKVIAEISVQENGFHQTRLAAANRLLEIAESMKPAAAESAPAKLHVIDSAKAAEELRRRLEGKK